MHIAKHVVIWIIWKDSSGTCIWMWWHLCISSNFTTSWKLKSCVWEGSRIQPVIKAASSQPHSENVFLCDLRPGAGSLNQCTFAFRYLLLKIHYGINCYIVLSYCFLENWQFMVENHARSVISIPEIYHSVVFGARDHCNRAGSWNSIGIHKRYESGRCCY